MAFLKFCKLPFPDLEGGHTQLSHLEHVHDTGKIRIPVVNSRFGHCPELLISTEAAQRDHFERALGQFQSGNPGDAVSICDKALVEFPGDANLLCLAAKAHLVMKNLADAERLTTEALRQQPDFAVAHDLRGDLSMFRDDADAAIKSWEQAMRLDPTRVHLLEKIEKASEMPANRKAASAATGGAPVKRMAFESEMQQAAQLHQSDKKREAETIYRNILKRDPNHVEAARLLAAVAVEHSRYRDAEVYLRHAAGIAPDYGRLWVDLANVLREQEKLDQALDCAQRILDLAPEKAESHMLMASVLGSMSRHEEAIAAYRTALEISPERTGAMCTMAHHLKTLGRQSEGVEMYRKAISAKPDHAEAYWSLANLKTFRFEDREVDAMLELLQGDELPDESRVQIHNALGLEFEGRKEYDQAFAHFEQCNALRRQSEIYDPVETETGFDRIIEIMDAAFFEDHQNLGSDDNAPILIVGMPRSGSTLIEQILASHSQVDGTHELGDLPKVAKRIRRFSPERASFPANLRDLSPENWKEVGNDYIESTRKFRDDAPNFIDKNPNNFIFIGLLKIALPGARIINARRHPLDSCFGTFKQLFASGQPFSYDMTELGEYYLQYQRLMDHWNEVIPGYVLDVQYEDVVADLEEQVRRILDFCNLPFEESCLRFHETDRAVKTASSEQVRRPIYSSSVNLWKHYEKNLDELFEILKPILK